MRIGVLGSWEAFLKKVTTIVLFLLILTCSLFAGKSITILKTGTEAFDITGNLKEYLGQRFEVKVYSIKENSAFSRLEGLKSDLIIFSSQEVSDLFRSYEGETPSTSMLAISNREFPQKNIKNITLVQAAPDALKELSRLYKTEIKSVGILYDESRRDEAESEVLFLEKGGYKVKTYDLPEVVELAAIKAGFSKFAKNNITHYRMLLNRVNSNTIKKNNDLNSFVQEQVSTIIVDDEDDWSSDFPENGVISVRNNMQFTAATLALVATAQLESGLPNNLKTVYVNSTISSLSIGKVQHYTLGDCGRSAIGSIKIMLSGVSRKISWADVEEFLGSCIGISYEGEKKVRFSKREGGFGNGVINFLSRIINHPYYAIVISVLLVLLVFTVVFYKLLKSIRDRKLIDCSVLFFPQDLKKLRIEADDKSVLLSKIFSKNGYMPIYTSSTILMQRLIRQYMPDIFVIDWRESNAVNYLRKELSGYSLSSAETVIIFNVPEDKAAEMKTAFGRAVTLCFTGIPEVQELVESLNKKGGSEAEISGRIRKDSLPSMLQVLESQKSSGCLVIEDDSPLSVIYYHMGRIVHAEDRVGNRGEEAIYTGLRCKRGRFFFLNDRAAPTHTTSFNSMEILLSYAERSDKENRHR